MKWKIISRSHFTSSNFKPLWCAEPQTQDATEDRNQRGMLGDVFGKFFIPWRQVLRMVTRCNRASQCQLSFCYYEDIQFEKLTVQFSKRQARRNRWQGVKDNDNDNDNDNETFE